MEARTRGKRGDTPVAGEEDGVGLVARAGKCGRRETTGRVLMATESMVGARRLSSRGERRRSVFRLRRAEA